MTEPIIHITRRDEWVVAQQTGEYRADSLSTEGFIHCSKPEQVVRVAETFYAGQHGLVLLVIDPRRLHSTVCAPRCVGSRAPISLMSYPGSPGLFPHIYGPINVDAVTQVLDFNPNANGKFALPRL